MLQTNENYDADQLKATQVEILKDIINITKRENLDYFIIAGTLIGAIRHQGFIPWDDDIDIAMTRKDYEALKKIINTEYSDKYFMQDYDTEPNFYMPFGKLRLNNTLYNEGHVEHLTLHKGIFIDIFILDKEPRVDGFMFNLRGHTIQVLNKLVAYRYVYQNGRNASPARKVITYASMIFPIQFLKNTQEKLMQKNNDNPNSEYLLNYPCRYGYKKQSFHQDVYFPAKEAQFEGITVSIPNKYDEMLTRIYGDYMTIPKEEDRETHDPTTIEFNQD